MKEKCLRSILLFSLLTLVVGNNVKASEEEHFRKIPMDNEVSSFNVAHYQEKFYEDLARLLKKKFDVDLDALDENIAGKFEKDVAFLLEKNPSKNPSREELKEVVFDLFYKIFDLDEEV